MPKKLIIVKEKNEVKDLLNWIDKDSIVVPLKYPIEKELRKHSVGFREVENYIDNEAYEKLGRYTEDLADSWYKQHENSFVFKGISLCPLIRLRVRTFFLNFLKRFELVTKMISLEKPDEIVIVNNGDSLSKLIVFLSERSNVKVKSVSSSLKVKESFNDFRAYFEDLMKSFIINHATNILKIFMFKRAKIKGRFKVLSWGSHKFFSVISELNKQKPVLVLEKDRYSQLQLLRNNINYKCASPLFSKARNDRKRITKSLLSFVSEKTFQDSFEYKGIKFGNIMSEDFVKWVLNLFYETLETIVVYDKIIRRYKPDVILLEQDSIPYTRTIVGVGKKHNVRSLIIQHGLTATRLGFFPIMADKFAAWGELSKEKLIEWGSEKDKIELTGYTRLDNYVKKETREKVCRELGLSAGKKIVVYAALSGESAVARNLGRRKTARALFTAMKQLPDVQLIVKKHPAENDDMLERLLLEAGLKDVVILKNLDARIVKTFSLMELLNACDLLITMYSTVGLEGIALDKPLITLNLDYKEDLIPYARFGAAIGVYDKNKIKIAVENALYDNKTLEKLKAGRGLFMKKSLVANDKRATERVVELVIGP